MFWENTGLMFQFLWVAFESLILPVITVVILVMVAINMTIKHWDFISYWLRVASRTVSWVLLKAAWAIIYLIDGKEAANKRL